MLDRLYIKGQFKLREAGQKIKNFFTAEDGVSNVVATIIILLIVVILIGIFWKQLKPWLEGMMDRIFSFDVEE